MANDRISQLPVEVVVANVPSVPAVTWRSGTITVPSSTGSGSVTGLGGTPKAVLFFGTNWTTEDSAVTTTGCGIFRGMAAPKYDDASLIQNAAFISPPGDQHINDNYAILALTTAGTATTLYRATIDSLDADGFSYTFDVAASGGYKVVWLAMMEDDTDVAVGAYVGAGNFTIPLGFTPHTRLYHGAWLGPSVSGNNRTQEWYGGVGGNAAAYLGALCFPTSSSGQTYNVINALQNPSTLAFQYSTFTGPFLNVGSGHVYVTGTYGDELRFDGDEQGGMVVAWNDPDSTTGFVTPATSQGGTASQGSLGFEPGLVIGYTISDETPGSGTGGRGAAGFYVATSEGFQWCATVDGSSSYGAFQSFQRGFCDAVNGTSVHAGTIEMDPDGFTMTTEEDDIAAEQTTWQAFGHPQKRGWIPQIVRYA